MGVFRPLRLTTGPLGGPSPYHLLCRWYLILVIPNDRRRPASTLKGKKVKVESAWRYVSLLKPDEKPKDPWTLEILNIFVYNENQLCFAKHDIACPLSVRFS